MYRCAYMSTCECIPVCIVHFVVWDEGMRVNHSLTPDIVHRLIPVNEIMQLNIDTEFDIPCTGYRDLQAS